NSCNPPDRLGGRTARFPPATARLRGLTPARRLPADRLFGLPRGIRPQCESRIHRRDLRVLKRVRVGPSRRVKCLLGPDQLRRVISLAHVGQVVEAVGGSRTAQPPAGLLPISWSSDHGNHLFVDTVDEGSGRSSSIGRYLSQVAANWAGV